MLVPYSPKHHSITCLQKYLHVVPIILGKVQIHNPPPPLNMELAPNNKAVIQ